MPLFKEINHETAYHLFKLAEKNSNDTAKSMLDFKYFYDLLDKKLTNEFKNRASTISDHNFILKNMKENIVYTRNDLISDIQKLQYAQDYSPDNLNNNSTFESELNYIGNIYALLIGVNDYDDQQLDTLQSPINDITLIEENIEKQF